MNDNMKKIILSINSVHTFPKKIIIHGIQMAIGMILIAICLNYINRNVYNYNSYVAFLIISMVKTSITIFAEVTISGLVIDYFIKKIGSPN